MPSVNKISKPPARGQTQISRSGSGGILDRIAPVSQPREGADTIRMNVYGRNGTGKTTFACTFPKPLLLVGFEDGTRSVRGVDGVDFVDVQSTMEVYTLAEMLRGGGHEYASVVLDTATSLQDLILKELLGLDEAPVQLAWGTVSQTQYRQRSEKVKELLRLFLAIKTLNVVVLAQEKNHSAKDGEGGGESDLLTPFVGSSLGQSACAWLQDGVDFICQTFTREQTEERSTTVGKTTVKTRVKTGGIEFCLRTQRAHPIYAAKFRADKGEAVPDVIVDPDYDKILAVTRGEYGAE